MSRPIRLAGVLALVAACLPVASASALSFPVTSTANEGAGTLRQSILAANAHIGTDSIPIELTQGIGLETALPTITDDLTIIGPGSELVSIARLQGSPPPFRILTFGDGVTATLSGVKIVGGLDPAGGGISNGSGSLTLNRVQVVRNKALAEGGTQAVARAGGILSVGPLTLRESYVWENTVSAVNGISQTVATGGGIEALGPLTIERSTISRNVAQALGEGATQVIAKGGGVLTLGELVAIEGSTISLNSIQAVEGSSQNVAQGAGLQGNKLTLTSSTVTGNEIASDEIAAGANLQFFGTTLVRDSIVSRPLGDADSCSGTISSGGFNLDEGHSCLFNASTDLTEVASGLNPELSQNGGPTPTHSLAESSPALDRGNSFGASVDQRGWTRPVDFAVASNTEGGDASDIGAFELQLSEGFQPGPAAVIVTLTPGDSAAPNTRILRGPSRLGFKRLAKFRFASTEPQSSFQCKLDKKTWKACGNPFERSVRPGKHLFKVRAIDRFGNVDPTPARFGWRVKPLS